MERGSETRFRGNVVSIVTALLRMPLVGGVGGKARGERGAPKEKCQSAAVWRRLKRTQTKQARLTSEHFIRPSAPAKKKKKKIHKRPGDTARTHTHK